LPPAHAREFVQLVQLAPLGGNPVTVAKQPVFAVDPFVMRQPDEHARQHRLPSFLLACGVSGFKRCLVGRGERLDQIEHTVPQAGLDAARALVIGRVLGGELGDDRLAARVDAQQCLRLRRPDAPAATGKRGDEVERLVLQLQRVACGQRGNPLRCRAATAKRVLQRALPRAESFPQRPLGDHGAAPTPNCPPPSWPL
jgi:hypothetical protein